MFREFGKLSCKDEYTAEGLLVDGSGVSLPVRVTDAVLRPVFDMPPAEWLRIGQGPNSDALRTEMYRRLAALSGLMTVSCEAEGETPVVEAVVQTDNDVARDLGRRLAARLDPLLRRG